MVELRKPFRAKCVKSLEVGTTLGENYLIEFIEFYGENILYFFFNDNNVLTKATAHYFYKLVPGKTNENAFYKTSGSSGQGLAYIPERRLAEVEKKIEEQKRMKEAFHNELVAEIKKDNTVDVDEVFFAWGVTQHSEEDENLPVKELAAKMIEEYKKDRADSSTFAELKKKAAKLNAKNKGKTKKGK